MTRGSLRRKKLVSLVNSTTSSGIVTKADLANLLTRPILKDELARLRKEIIDLKKLMIILWAVQVLFFTGMSQSSTCCCCRLFVRVKTNPAVYTNCHSMAIQRFLERDECYAGKDRRYQLYHL